MNDKINDEAEKWFYDLGELAKVVEANSQSSIAAHKRYDKARRRTRVLAIFCLFAFLLLSYRTELQQDRISENTNRIIAANQRACESGLQILRTFNMQQDALILIEETNRFIDDELRQKRIKAYSDARIEPLPVCDLQ